MANGHRHYAALAPGSRFHWYEVDSILGQGGFGITYAARDINLDQKVAIKEFLPAEFAVRTADSSVQPLSEKHVDTYGWRIESFSVCSWSLPTKLGVSGGVQVRE